MTNPPGVWGIDIGQCAFKALRLEVIEGTVTATAFDYIEHPKILSQPDADPDQLIREALDKFLERNVLKGDVVVIGIPGQSGLARFVKLPPVEEKKIGDIVRFEAKQQIPFPLDEVIWDYQKIGSGLVTDGFAMETEIGLFAMKRDVIQRFLQHFIDVNIEVNIVQMAPLALCNFISFELLGKNPLKQAAAEGGEAASTAIQAAPDPAGGKKRCVVALDIGADNSNLVITDGDKIIWQRPIPLGGNHFTRALTKELKLTFAKAEHLKRNATKSPDLKKILGALKPVLNEFVGEVQRSLGYFTNTHRDSQVEYMIGLGNAFRLPGLQKYLSEKLSIDVRKPANLTNVTGEAIFNVPAFSSNVMSYAMAYGLAVQGLKLARLQTNLLPQEIRVAREIRAKKPWAVATAAALLVGVSASLAGYALQYNAVHGEVVIKELDADKLLLDEIGKWQSKFGAVETKCKEDETAIKNFIAGQDERLNWIMLNRFINDCLPVAALRVDGKLESLDNGKCVLVNREGKKQDFLIDDKTTFLWTGDHFVDPAERAKLKKGADVAVVYHTEPNLKKYWGTRDALAAYRSYWSRQAQGKGVNDTKSDDDDIDALIQINIESVFSMYTTDLAGYFANLQRVPNYQDHMSPTLSSADKAKAPEGKGWVIEVQGYTYHKEKREFIVDSFLTALATKAGKPAGEATAAASDALAAAAAPGGAAPAEVKPAAAAPADPKSPAEAKADAVPAKDAPADAPKNGESKPNPFDTIIAGKISHVFLENYMAVRDPQPGAFQLLGGSVVSGYLQSMSSMMGDMMDMEAMPGDLAGASAAGGAPPMGSGMGGKEGGDAMGMGGMMAGMMGGMMGGMQWTPLSGSMEAGMGMGMGMGNGMGVGPGFGGNLMSMGPQAGISPDMMRNMPGGGGFGGMRPSANVNASAPGMAPVAPAVRPGAPGSIPGMPPGLRKISPTRAEFVILFIWQEPTPSDDRMESAAPAAAPAAGGAMIMPAAPATPAPAAPPPPAAPAAGGRALPDI